MALSRNIKEQKQKLENPTAESEGIKITILKPGDAVNFPKIGDSISVHYICFLDNETMVDNSYLRGQPALFVLGSNQVIRGWEEVLLSGAISKGEKARLVIPSELAYGERGYPPIIPPFSNLTFEIEIMSFSSANAARRQKFEEEKAHSRSSTAPGTM